MTNPTPRRVEAVVSVDGLDAIDGRAADFAQKRGYVIAPYGSVTLDGWRTSLDTVATFRFSSVRDSYAGRKGDARNVGVIGVAFFPERERPVPRPLEPRAAPTTEGGGRWRSADPRAGAEPAAPPAKAGAGGPGGTAAADGTAERRGAARDEDRPGLGTEYGERRYSSVGYTSFERESPARPRSVVEIRYDDRQGLLALGVPLDEPWRPRETAIRQSADPFPGSRWAEPPPAGW